MTTFTTNGHPWKPTGTRGNLFVTEKVSTVNFPRLTGTRGNLRSPRPKVYRGNIAHRAPVETFPRLTSPSKRQRAPVETSLPWKPFHPAKIMPFWWNRFPRVTFWAPVETYTEVYRGNISKRSPPLDNVSTGALRTRAQPTPPASLACRVEFARKGHPWKHITCARARNKHAQDFGPEAVFLERFLRVPFCIFCAATGTRGNPWELGSPTSKPIL